MFEVNPTEFDVGFIPVDAEADIDWNKVQNDFRFSGPPSQIPKGYALRLRSPSLSPCIGNGMAKPIALVSYLKGSRL